MKKKTGFQASLRKPLQQGDVLLRPLDGVPSDATKHLDMRGEGCILQRGEHTGHAHVAVGVMEADVVMYERNGTLYLSAPTGARVNHEEHHTISVPPGNYEVGIVQEYDHFAEEARQVMD